MHRYDCCDKLIPKSKKLNMLSSRVEKGLEDHFADFNLEYMIVYIKKRKL